MDHHIVSDAQELGCLTGWMSERCRAADEALSRWMHSAEIGQMQEHRLGLCVRLRDVN